MQELHTQMDKHGRLLIPSRIRNSLQYKPGDTFVIRTNSDELHITSLTNVIKNAQRLFKEHSSSNFSAVDEFLEQKYQEANKENNKF